MPSITDCLQSPYSDEDLGALFGVSRERVGQLIAAGVFERGQTAHRCLVAYLERLREQAAGRDVDGALGRERARLTKSQRVGQDLRNAIVQGEYAPIGLLADVLAFASATLAERLEALPGRLKTAYPALPDAAREAIEVTVATARAEWLRSTAELSEAHLDAIAASPDDDEASES